MNRTIPFFFLLLISISVLPGCRGGKSAEVNASPLMKAAASSSAPSLPKHMADKPAIDLLKVRPNELGKIPVLMYHDIGADADEGPRYDRHGLNIPPDTFRKQLELMYAAGWYPVNMRDALTPRMDVPAGKIPVVLTFDDARGTQIHYKRDGSMDPNCAVAIMEQFHAEHPDWPLKASFYLLPKSKWNPVPFYQPGRETKKLQYLAKQGYELANHSTSHRRMDRMDAHLLAWEMAECARYVKKRAPGATMDTMALPMGYVPRTRALLGVLLRGMDGGTSYENRCILRAWGGATPSPADKKFDRMDILRIGSEPGYIEGWIKIMKRGQSVKPFISDGDPDTVTVPKSAEKNLDKPRLAGLKVVVWDDTPPKKVKKSADAKKHKASK